MRKVFLCTMIQELNYGAFISDDFELNSNKFEYPISYLVEKEIEENDDILIVVLTDDQAEEKVRNFENEINQIINNKSNITINFKKITSNDKFNSRSCNSVFKSFAKILQNGDNIYLDITGIKPYSFSLFIASAYAVKTCQDTTIKYVIFVEDIYEKEKKVSKICDLSSLFYLNEIVGEAETGSKKSMDKLLDLVIKD